MVPRGMYSASPGRRTTSMWGSPSCDAGSCVWSFFPCAETGSCAAQPDDRVATGSAPASLTYSLSVPTPCTSSEFATDGFVQSLKRVPPESGMISRHLSSLCGERAFETPPAVRNSSAVAGRDSAVLRSCASDATSGSQWIRPPNTQVAPIRKPSSTSEARMKECLRQFEDGRWKPPAAQAQPVRPAQVGCDRVTQAVCGPW